MAWIPETGEGRFRVFQETKKGLRPRGERKKAKSKKQNAKNKKA